MATGEDAANERIVELLKKDAAEASRTRGSKRPKGNAPKPNTRFLTHLLRETDSHNAALKAKEEAESRARLRELRDGRRSRKRTRDASEERDGDVKRKKRTEEKPGRWKGVLGSLAPRAKRAEAERRNARRGLHEEKKHSRQRGESRTRTRSLDRRKERRSASPVEKETRRSRRSRADSDSDSDPLAEVIGPRLPPVVRARGRGADRGSNIDARFDPAYDPRTEVGLEEDGEGEDDWEMALEALRDRTRWRVQGGDRLRAAGFTEEEVRKWEKGGAERDVEDVRWRKKGEGREWDRGKTVVGDGVDVRPDWKRSEDS